MNWSAGLSALVERRYSCASSRGTFGGYRGTPLLYNTLVGRQADCLGRVSNLM